MEWGHWKTQLYFFFGGGGEERKQLQRNLPCLKRRQVYTGTDLGFHTLHTVCAKLPFVHNRGKPDTPVLVGSVLGETLLGEMIRCLFVFDPLFFVTDSCLSHMSHIWRSPLAC